ncbi:MAG TPA: glycosyltransferase family A protein [Planctomycetota bacterium]|nr:glycosyltransferase family A protein [Planctomycetota bacterium]
MEIHGLTCSVGYAPTLSLGIARWRAGLDSLSVVTDLRDEDTVALAAKHGARVHRTGVFYDRGDFRKAAALEEARVALVPRTGWLLLFDADVIPPPDWRAVVEAHVRHGSMHGATRHQCDDPARPDPALWPEIRTDGRRAMGYFQLFAQDDPRAFAPVLDGRWRHAGVYDSVLCDRWPAPLHVRLPLRLCHVGPRDNWGGLERGPGYVRDLMAERKKHGGTWGHEAVS